MIKWYIEMGECRRLRIAMEKKKKAAKMKEELS